MGLFQYANALDLNMGYCTIILSSSIQDMASIVPEFGKFKYNCLIMGICTSGYIFQAKVDEVIGDIKGVKTYIDGILVLIKERLSQHIKNRG